jgi:hypothetical protein
MYHEAIRIRDTGTDIVRLEVRHFIHNLDRRESRRQQVQNIRDTDPHAAHTRPTATMAELGSDAIQQI